MRAPVAKPLIGMGLLLALTGASAPNPRSYETEWEITQDASAELLAPREIPKQAIVFQQRIRFARLAVSDIAVTEAANGEVFVPAGEQFYKALTQGPELWCTANMKMPEGALMTSVIGRVYSQYCILDADNDGVFDGFFKRARTIEVLPTVRGKITPNPRPIRPLKLSQVDPASLRTDYFVGVTFEKLVGKEPDRSPRFQRFAGSEHGRFLIEDAVYGSPGSNQSIVLEGAEIRYSVQGDGLTVHSVKLFPSGPVRIKGTNCGMINGC